MKKRRKIFFRIFIFVLNMLLISYCSEESAPVSKLDAGKDKKTDLVPDIVSPDVLDSATIPDVATIPDIGQDVPPLEEISCGTTVCQAGIEICCITRTGALCLSEETACEGAKVICDGPEDCLENYCCVAVNFKADIIRRTAEHEGRTECTSSCNFAFNYDPRTGQGEVTARACHTSTDCLATEPVCCAVPGIGTGMCLTAFAATLLEEYTYGLLDCS